MSVNTDSLESMCELIVDCPHSTPKWTDEGLIVLRNQNIRNGVLDLSAPSFTNEEDFQKRIRRAVPQTGDIVFTREAPMGEVCMIPEGLQCCLGQRQVLLRPKDNVSGKYLFWALQSPFVQQKISWNEGTGSTVSNVRIPVLKALNIPRHPGKEEQIAKVLSDLAGKIQLNRQLNQTLEQIAQAIFKSWFVDFEPVRAKIAAKKHWQAMDETIETSSPTCYAEQFDCPQNTIGLAEAMNQAAMRAISGKTDEELEQLSSEQRQQLAATAALFPDEPEESELGEIPKGWEVNQIQDLAKTIKGKSYKSTELEESNTVLVTLKSFNRGGGYRLDGLKEYTGKYKPEQEVFAGDLIIAYTDVTQAADVIGKPAMIVSDSRYDHLAISLDVAVVRPKVDSHKYFLYGMAKTEIFQQHTRSYTTGTTVLHLGKTAVPEYKFPKPSEGLLEAFKIIVAPMFDLINERIEESKNMERLRDALLPKLLSGEITVDDHQATKGAVA